MKSRMFCPVIAAIFMTNGFSCEAQDANGESSSYGIPKQSGTYLVKDDFHALTNDGMPTPWSTDLSGGTISLKEGILPGSRCAQLEKNDSDKIVSATRKFTPAGGKVVVEIKVRAEDFRSEKTMPGVWSSDDICAVCVRLEGRNLVADNGDASAIVQPFNEGEWYLIRLEIDTESGKYDLYVDGLKMLDGGSLKTPVKDIARITCSMDTGGSSIAYFDAVTIYSHEGLIGKPPKPIFDVADYGAVGDGTTKNTEALQKAIDACAGSGGSIYLHDGKFLTGTLTLKSKMTLFVDSTATLLGSQEDGDYPPNEDVASNMAVTGYRKAFLYASKADQLRIDGGGTIDGSGTAAHWRANGHEEKRPFLINLVQCRDVAIQNVYLKDAAMWCMVPVLTDYLAIRNVDIDSRCYGNRDGIDLVDTRHVIVENCTINTDDDSICPKSGAAGGLDDITVRNCHLAGSVRASGIKFGTAGYGQLKNSVFEDITLKNTDKSAIALECVDGADVADVSYKRIDIYHTNSPIYIVIGNRGRTPKGAAPKIGSVDTVLFEDIQARNLKYNTGCPISGDIIDGVRYPLKNLTFNRCKMTFLGGATNAPESPPEMGKQYPECNLWGTLPAYGYFIRHADNVIFSHCTTSVFPEDTRPWLKDVDVNDLKQN